MRVVLRAFAVVAYLGFLGSMGGFVALVVGWLPRRPPEPPLPALAVDVALCALFGLSHSIMARARFKRWSRRLVAPAAERSVYVLVASLALALLAWQWRPVAGAPVWTVAGAGAALFVSLQLGGFGFALVSTWLIDYWELYGLRQAFAATPADTRFRTPLFYRAVRHPQYLGLLVAFWAAPHMTVDRLALAVGLTVYLAIGARLEERDLVDAFGDEYRRYRRRVPMLLPRIRRSPEGVDAERPV